MSGVVSMVKNLLQETFKKKKASSKLPGGGDWTPEWCPSDDILLSQGLSMKQADFGAYDPVRGPSSAEVVLAVPGLFAPVSNEIVQIPTKQATEIVEYVVDYMRGNGSARSFNDVTKRISLLLQAYGREAEGFREFQQHAEMEAQTSKAGGTAAIGGTKAHNTASPFSISGGGSGSGSSSRPLPEARTAAHVSSHPNGRTEVGERGVSRPGPPSSGKQVVGSVNPKGASSAAKVSAAAISTPEVSSTGPKAGSKATPKASAAGSSTSWACSAEPRNSRARTGNISGRDSAGGKSSFPDALPLPVEPYVARSSSRMQHPPPTPPVRTSPRAKSPSKPSPTPSPRRLSPRRPPAGRCTPNLLGVPSPAGSKRTAAEAGSSEASPRKSARAIPSAARAGAGGSLGGPGLGHIEEDANDTDVINDHDDESGECELGADETGEAPVALSR